MANPIELADKIMLKVSDTLAPLQFEMDRMKWPQEFRKILWEAIAAEAAARALEQLTGEPNGR